MDIVVYSEGIKARGLSPSDTQLALAIFAYEYVELVDSKQITNYEQFKFNICLQ